MQRRIAPLVALALSLAACAQPLPAAQTAAPAAPLFAALDRDGDRRLAGPESSLLSALDGDRDGSVSATEWKAAEQADPAALRRKLHTGFVAALDRNGDGALSRTEAAGTWLETGFDRADASRDAKLSATELDRFLAPEGARAQSLPLIGAIGAGAVGVALAGYLAYAGQVGANDMMYPKGDAFRKAPDAYGMPYEAVDFKSHDGLKLKGWYVPAESPTDKGLVVFHGHASNKDVVFKKYGQWLRSKYNLFLFDSRAHGESEGKFTTLGYFERQDVPAALEELKKRGNTRIGFLGESMGGAIAIQSGAVLSEVKAVWNDCAYDSLQDAIAPRAQARKYPLPGAVAWAVIRTVSARAKGEVVEADPIRWVDKIGPRPFYLVHGMKDDETLPLNGEKLFAKAQEPKQAWWTPEAKHADSWKLYPDEYRTRTFAFFEGAL